MRKFLIILFLFLSIKINAQTYFNNRYDFPNVHAALATSVVADSSYYYILFQTIYFPSVNGQYTCAFIRMDHSGNILDTNFYLISNAATFSGQYGSLSKSNSGFIAGSSFQDSLRYDALLIKINDSGDTTWMKAYGDSLFQNGTMAKQTPDGGFLLCGQTTTYHQRADIYLLKTDSLGNFEWEQHYGDTINPGRAYAFCFTHDGGFAVGGTKQYLNGNWDVMVVKTDSLGNENWTKNFGPSTDNWGYNIISSNDGNLLVVGTRAYQNGQAPKPYLAKLDLSGNILWEKEYGPDTNTIGHFYSIKELNDGSIIAVGDWSPAIPSPNPSEHYGIIYKIASNGDSLWSHLYFNAYPTNSNFLFDAYPNIDGGFIACGTVVPKLSDTGYQQIWILKIDSIGCEIANCTLDINDFLSKENTVKVFPNPFTDILNLEFEEEKFIYEIRLYNILGEEIKHEKSSRERNYSLKTDELASGLYLLNITQGNRPVYSGKVSHVKE